jgi:serine O-acetyltransferase
MKTALPSLAAIGPYEAWTEEQVWEMTVLIVERDCPLNGVRERLDEYRALFSGVYRQMLFEHRAVLGTHFRTAKGEPFVNPLNIEHLTRLLHLLSHQIYLAGGDSRILDALFFVLKSRCQINLFYKQPVDRFFFAFHAIGAVLGYGQYGAFLVVSQGSTIGQNRNQYPTIGNNVIVGPGAMVLGRSQIGTNVFIGAGTLIVDRTIPSNTVVYGRPPSLVTRPNDIDNRSINFDLDELKRLGEV